MKISNQNPRHTGRLATLLVALTGIILSTSLPAQDAQAVGPQKRFASAEEATKALQEAATAGDRDAVHAIFGPDVTNLMTGDKVQDDGNFKGFSEAMATACVPVSEGNDKVILNIGTNEWPFPIPLVKKGGQWFFDTDAGREEVINRHVGRDELNAIGVCRAYVKAQRDYFSKDRDGSGVQKYALKFKSTPGKEDGLYWPETNNEASPFGALVAEAHAEGYGHNHNQPGPHSFHGYFFRILTSQGRAAPGGKKDYTVDGDLTGGFALAAYPERWGKSGIMTFIVNQDGQVYQRDLGERTEKKAANMKGYNPDQNWTPVPDAGVFEQE